MSQEIQENFNSILAQLSHFSALLEQTRQDFHNDVVDLKKTQDAIIKENKSMHKALQKMYEHNAKLAKKQ